MQGHGRVAPRSMPPVPICQGLQICQNCSDYSTEVTEGVTSTPEIFGNKQGATSTPEIFGNKNSFVLTFLIQQIQFTLIVNVVSLN